MVLLDAMAMLHLPTANDDVDVLEFLILHLADAALIMSLGIRGYSHYSHS